jgi:Pentapeptide repeats (8 copies)
MSFWLIAIAILIAICALAAWWLLPRLWVNRLRHDIPNGKDRADVEDNFRKTIGQLIGGAAVLLGAGLAYFQTQETLHGQLDQTTRTLNSQLAQTQQTVTSQLISKAIDSLGEKEDRAKRLAAIYTLESVMESEQYHQMVLNILCGFVRISTGSSPEDQPPAPEVQSALDVITRPRKIGGQIMLANARIPQATLNNANLKGAGLNSALLNSAHLQSADLSEGAELVNADLTSADMFNINLSNTNLTHAILIRAQLYSATLTNANLTDANLSYANLNGSNWSGANLSNTNLENAQLSDALNLTPAQLSGACGNDATELPRSMEQLKLKPCPSK